jgi:F0F1-type ATP synthase assembly protein I
VKEYWFARRFPLRDMRSGMAPIHWKGWAVAVAFVAAMAIGGILGWWFTDHGQMTKGIVVFGAFAVGAAIGFIGVAHRMGDHVRTVADYREDRKSASGQ